MKKTVLITVIVLFVANTLKSQSTKSDEIRLYSDMLYISSDKVQNDTLQRLNLVIPENVKKPPLLLWIGGGAWSYVNRNMEMDLAEQFAKKGIAVAAVGHRLSTAVWRDPSFNKGIKHPEHIKDIAVAFKWLYDHAEEYGYDRNNIFVGGYSSGGHLAALLSTDRKYLKKHGLSTSTIRGVIPIAGAYDISDYHSAFANGTRKHLADEHVKAVFGDTEKHFQEASPTNYVSQMNVPMLLISERQSYNYTKIFEDKIKESSFTNIEVIHISELGHGELWRDLSHNDNSKYRKKIIDFIKGDTEPAQ